MKKLIYLFFCGLAMAACSDAVDLSERDASLQRDGSASQDDITPVPVAPYTWRSRSVPYMSNYPFNYPEGNNRIITIDSDVYCLIGSLQEFAYKLNLSTRQWERFDDQYSMYLPYSVGHQFLFSYQSKMYYGFMLGYGGDAYVHAKDPVTGAQVDVPDFPGLPVNECISFTIGNKGYVVGGNRNGFVSNQIWEYDFIANTWTSKGTIPGGPRAGGVAFVKDNKVYIGLGYDIWNLNGVKIRRYKKDWISFDPAVANALGATKAEFPGPARTSIKSFSINNKFYVGWGYGGGSGGTYTDFWEYNPSNNTWTEKTQCPATNTDSSNINVFSIGNTAYLVKGYLAEFWRYGSSPLIPVPVND